MKTLLTLTIALFVCTYSIAQHRKIDNDDKCPIDDPLDYDIFDRMIVNDITYAITGENTPVSGLKVDISKPEATVSGLFIPKPNRVPWDLVSFDLKGGITDRNFVLFKGYNSFNTSFEARPSFHFVPPWNSAHYGTCSEATPKALLIHAKNNLVDAGVSRITDSMIAIALIRHHYLQNSPVTSEPVTLPMSPSATQVALMQSMVRKITNNAGHNITVANLVGDLNAALPPAAYAGNQIQVDAYTAELLTMHERLWKAYQKRDDDAISKKIQNAASIWTKKTYYWFTVTPFAKTDKITQYYTKYQGRDSFYFNSGYDFFYGASLYANHYIVYPKKVAHFLRLSWTGSKSNNLTTLSSFNYETRSPLYSYGTTVTEKTKSGTAYNADEVKSGFVSQFAFDYYLLPLKSLVPGLYVSFNLNNSELYNLNSIVDRADDNTQFGAEGGLVFNVNSREKDKEKNLLSILLYCRFEDLTDKRRTSVKTGVEESGDDFQKRNLIFGIRVGIPISLPQSSD